MPQHLDRYIVVGFFDNKWQQITTKRFGHSDAVRYAESVHPGLYPVVYKESDWFETTGDVGYFPVN